jgi:hypothetical protein
MEVYSMIEFEIVKNLNLKEILDRSIWNLGGDIVIEGNLNRSYEELKCEKIVTEYGDRYIINAYDWEKRVSLLGLFKGWQTRGNLKYITDQDNHMIIRGRAVQVHLEEGLVIEGL